MEVTLKVRHEQVQRKAERLQVPQKSPTSPVKEPYICQKEAYSHTVLQHLRGDQLFCLPSSASGGSPASRGREGAGEEGRDRRGARRVLLDDEEGEDDEEWLEMKREREREKALEREMSQGGAAGDAAAGHGPVATGEGGWEAGGAGGSNSAGNSKSNGKGNSNSNSNRSCTSNSESNGKQRGTQHKLSQYAHVLSNGASGGARGRDGRGGRGGGGEGGGQGGHWRPFAGADATYEPDCLGAEAAFNTFERDSLESRVSALSALNRVPTLSCVDGKRREGDVSGGGGAGEEVVAGRGKLAADGALKTRLKPSIHALAGKGVGGDGGRNGPVKSPSGRETRSKVGVVGGDRAGGTAGNGQAGGEEEGRMVMTSAARLLLLS